MSEHGHNNTFLWAKKQWSNAICCELIYLIHMYVPSTRGRANRRTITDFPERRGNRVAERIFALLFISNVYLNMMIILLLYCKITFKRYVR